MALRVDVRIGSEVGVYWGEYTAKSYEDLKEKVALSIEALHPLNSSPEGAEAYRERFRGQPLYIKHYGEKGYQSLS